MSPWIEYALFLAKSVTIMAFFIVAIILLFSLVYRQSLENNDRLKVRSLNKQHDDYKSTMQSELLTSKNFKKWLADEKKQHKDPDETTRPRLFILKFDGDIKANAVDSLREEITAIILAQQPNDEVLLRLESPGGHMHAYGLAASQLERVKRSGMKLTIAVDNIAASGGYMMACVAHHIIAAPFAMLGSIGVIGQVPNIHRLLEKHHVDVELHTAGKYKQTLTLLGKNTDEGRNKFKEELTEAHQLFQQFVARMRPIVDIENISTGECWFGLQALERKLVDTIGTSDDFIIEATKRANVFEITYMPEQSLWEKISSGAAVQAKNVANHLLSSLFIPRA